MWMVSGFYRIGGVLMSNVTLPMSPEELEALVRRVVREEIRRALKRPASILEDQRHAGPEDPAEDQQLLEEAMIVLQGAGDDPAAWLSWEELEAELNRAEATGELPD
jgi:hypothetical protein